MRIAIVGGVVALVVAATVSSSVADIGPPEPARKACMGLAAGAPCTLDGKAGTCRGTHPLRIGCEPDQPSSQGSGSAAAGSGTDSAVGSTVGSATADHAPSNAETTTPGHKRGCAVASPGSAAPVGLAVVALALALRRRRRSRSMR